MSEKIEAQSRAEVNNLRHKDMLARTIPATNSTMQKVEKMIKTNLDEQVNLNDIHKSVNEILDKTGEQQNIAAINTIEDVVIKNLDEQQDIDIIDKKIDNIENIVKKNATERTHKDIRKTVTQILKENQEIRKELAEIKKLLKQ